MTIQQATEKTFAFAGVSDLNGEYKLRVANDAARVKVLAKNGHKDIRMLELPEAMTKQAACALLKDHADFQDELSQSAFVAFETGGSTGTGYRKVNKQRDANGENLFSYAGVSDLNGVYKLRVANDASRVKVLQKNGHKDIRLVELPEPMTKLQAIEFIKDMPEFEDLEAQQAFADYSENNGEYKIIRVQREPVVVAETKADEFDLDEVVDDIMEDFAE